MKQDVMIQIKSIISADGEDEHIEVTTKGRRLKKGSITYLSYKETDQNGFDGNSVLIKAEGDERVTISRLGSARSQLLVEAGKRHLCSYSTPFGTQTLGITCSGIKAAYSGGEIKSISLIYELDLNNILLSKNQLFITVKECAN